MNTNTDIFLQWQAAAHPEHERSPRWYLFGGALCAVMAVYGLLSATWGMTIVFAMIPALYYLVRNQSHMKHDIQITNVGIVFDGRTFLWGELSEFWILAGPGYHELHIAQKKKTRADIVIQTGNIDPYAIIDLLSQVLPQVADRRERILDAIIRYCKI